MLSVVGQELMSASLLFELGPNLICTCSERIIGILSDAKQKAVIHQVELLEQLCVVSKNLLQLLSILLVEVQPFSLLVQLNQIQVFKCC